MLKSTVSWLAHLTKLLAISANITGVLMVLVLMIVVSADAVARDVFHAPFRGAYEVIQFSLILIVFLQLPDVCGLGA